jgi:hypothetical protein
VQKSWGVVVGLHVLKCSCKQHAVVEESWRVLGPLLLPPVLMTDTQLPLLLLTVTCLLQLLLSVSRQ